MNILQKIGIVVATLSVLVPASAGIVTFVADTYAFQERAERRWLNDDIIATRKRIWDLEKTFPDGNMPPSVVIEHIRLKSELEMMYRQLEVSK